MLKNEAKKLGQILLDYKINCSPVIMMGSNKKLNGPKGQSFIYEYLIQPLQNEGVKFFHTDMDITPGDDVFLDVSGDFFEDEVMESLISLNANTVICANILEHVRDPELFIKRVFEIIPSGGMAIFSVPSSFPYHLAPIDTYFRPTPNELSALCKNNEVLFSEEILCGSFATHIYEKPQIIIRYLLQIALFFINPGRALGALHRFLWLFKDFKVSVVLVKKISYS